MPKKRFSAEQIVTLLRQIEVLIAPGKSTPVACPGAGMPAQPQHRSDCLESNARTKTGETTARSFFLREAKAFTLVSDGINQHIV